MHKEPKKVPSLDDHSMQQTNYAMYRYSYAVVCSARANTMGSVQEAGDRKRERPSVGGGIQMKANKKWEGRKTAQRTAKPTNGSTIEGTHRIKGTHRIEGAHRIKREEMLLRVTRFRIGCT